MTHLLLNAKFNLQKHLKEADEKANREREQGSHESMNSQAQVITTEPWVLLEHEV